MNVRIKHWAAQLFALLFAALLQLIAPANNASAQDRPAFSQQELDQMLAPIALYPDPLLAQIVMASTYPRELVEAERWSMANAGLRGDRAVRAVARNNWDPSVKSLVAFPQILRMMNERLDWTQRLGDAFLGQQQQVMDTVQDLRHRAYSAGNLRSNDQIRVQLAADYISIEQADSRLAYEAYYDPFLVYGSWWWPQYPPMHWAPWPGYRERAGFGAGIFWGVGIVLGAEFFYGAFDWRQHRINTANVGNTYHRRDANVANGASSPWQHDPTHRRGAPYRAAAVGARFTPSGAAPAGRAEFRGHLPATTEQRNQQASHPDTRSEPVKPRVTPDVQPAAAAPGPRAQERGRSPVEVAPAVRGSPDGGGRRMNAAERGRSEGNTVQSPANLPAAVVRPAVVPVEPRPHVLENVGKAAEVRDSSARGRASRQATAAAARPAEAARPAAGNASPRAPERATAPAATPPAPAPAHAAGAKRAPEKTHEGRGRSGEGK